MTATERRKRSQDRKGLALFAAMGIAVTGALTLGWQADSARGLTVSESLASAGFGSPAERVSARFESPAREVRLIGLCDGRLMAALEESSFPAGCEWIEPIRSESAFVNPMTGKAGQ